ncbi:MAG: DUF3857 domain-containing protein [Bacteroidales bacterium]|nr:DUF3857 domain-containing protein [Bacteroidales bacterium]
MKKTSHIIALVMMTALLSAQEPDTDAVFKKIIREYTLNPDGSQDYHYFRRVRLVTHFSFNRLYGETFIVYNPQYQTLKINKAYTIDSKGQEVPVPENAFNEVLPRFASDAPAFNNLREMVVTHTGLEVGATIVLDYSIHTQPGYFPALMGNEVLCESSTVEDEEFVIRVPADRTLNYRVFNLRTSPDVTEEEGSKVYTFSFRDLLEQSHDPFQPAHDTHLPRLAFSTATLEDACSLLTGQEAFQYRCTESMKKAVAAIREQEKDDRIAAVKIRKLVVNDLNLHPVPPEYTGYTLRTPAEVWESNGGTSLEKCLLMTALLRDAGISAFPVILFPSALFDESMGCLPLASRYLVQVNPREREQLYLSPTELSDQSLVCTMRGEKAVLLDPDRQARIENPEIPGNGVKVTGTFGVAGDMSVKGRLHVEVSGVANPYLDLIADTTAVKRLFNGISSREVISVTLEQCNLTTSVFSCEIECSPPEISRAGFVFVPVPEYSKGSRSWHMDHLLPGRESPLQPPFNIWEEYDITWSLPQGYTAVVPGDETFAENDYGKVSVSVAFQDGKVRVMRLLAVSGDMVPAGDAGQFRELINTWNDSRYREIILVKE